MTVYLVPGHSTTQGLQIWMMGWDRPGEPSVAVHAGSRAIAAATRYEALAVPLELGWPIGVLTLAQLDPGQRYELRFPSGTQPEVLRLQTLPDAIPPEGLTFALACCYYHGLDGGRLARALLNLPAYLQPAFKLLAGDHLYTDVPWFWTGNGDTAIRDYGRRYRDYWTSRDYQPFLTHSPNFFTCDDHEFWNNYPDESFWLARSTDPAERPKYMRAALLLYDLFQSVANPGRGRWYSFDIAPVSFFVTDTRSQRELYGPNAGVMDAEQERALRQWASTLTGPGILVLGQPLFTTPGNATDRTLADYPRHYTLLWELIENAGHDILLLSGDIHIGRYAIVPQQPGIRNRPQIAEFIASPTSLVPPSPIGSPFRLPQFLRGRVEAPSRVYPQGSTSSASRDVYLQWGTHADNFGLITLARRAPGHPHIRATLQLWDIEEQQPALSLRGRKVCCEELLLT